MNGAQILSSVDLGNVSASWNIVGTGAYNAGNGKAELFWRDNSGNWRFGS